VLDGEGALISRPVRYVQLKTFEALSGYTPKAIEGKIAKGAWMEGREFRRAPDHHVLVDLQGYEKWVERGVG
jgi:hypothetical protein